LLLRWFQRHRRDLPWRHSRDPYAIWVSEVMLQQTQVVTVVPFFERFLAALPTVRSLAAANEGEVLKLWEGLGYYRRARDLHRAAQILVKEHGGAVPDDAEHFRRLPGVGRYTLGAVLSLAFDRRLPIVEANSARVLCRLFGCTGDACAAAGQRWLWTMAEHLLPARRVGDFNQALMELGALVCTPRQPRCDSCPLRRHCAAHREGLVDSIPVRVAEPTTTKIAEAAIVIGRRNRVLLLQRPANTRWANLWEFPHGTIRDGERVHGITRFQITMQCYQATVRSGRFRSSFYQRHAWVRPEQLADYALSTPQRQIARAIVGRVSNPSKAKGRAGSPSHIFA
jgi:A/G-specific adenine glycosylase